MNASPEELMEQAVFTAGDYLKSSVTKIDKEFGKGYAKKHPELIGAFMQTAALDFLATHLSSSIFKAVANIPE